MKIPELASKDNPLIKTIRLISSGSRRLPEQLVLAEGIRMLEEVEKAGFEIVAVVLSDEFGKAPRERSLLNRFCAKGIRIYKTKGSLFRLITAVQTPQGAVALVKVPEAALDSITPAKDSLILCACGIQDPGNLGTLIRTAAAAGANLVCTSKGTVSARNPKAIRSSAGSFFRIPVVEHTDTTEFQMFCENHSIRIYRTDAREGVIFTEADLKSPCAILLGNEGAGISERGFESVPSIRIPMAQGMESLNVAIAGAIILFEACRQRMSELRIGNRE